MIRFKAKFDELFGIDIRALAVMRIVFSLFLLYDLIERSFNLTAFYTDQGVLPRVYALKLLNPNDICLHLMNGTWGFQAFLFFLSGVFLVGLLLGYKTRLCTVVTWVLLCSMHNRNILVLGAEDKLMHILFFWFMFLPWGACYSLDRHFQSTKKAIPVCVSSMASVGYLLQISFFYAFAGLLKTHSQWTTEGTAIYYVLNLDQFTKPLAHDLLRFPNMVHYLSFYVLWLERWGAFFFFCPIATVYVRMLALLAFASFHLGLFSTMELNLFQPICLATLIGFLPTVFLNKFLKPIEPKSDVHPVSSWWKLDLFKMPAYLSILLGFFILYSFFWNMEELEGRRYKIPQNMQWIGHTFSVYQHWGMFGPRPMTDDDWCVLSGKLRDGSVVNVFRNKSRPIAWDEPGSIIKYNDSYNWTLYYLNIRHNNNAAYRLPYIQYVCREWNRTHQGGEQLLNVDLINMHKDILPDYRKPVPQKVLLASYDCIKNFLTYQSSPMPYRKMKAKNIHP